MPNPIHFKFSLPIGDFWYASAGIKHVCSLLKTTAVIHFGLGTEMKFYDGIRPALTEKTFQMAKPLIEDQAWCHSAIPYVEGVHIDRDLDKTQIDPAINIPVMPYGHIARWYFYLWPEMACDLCHPWITSLGDEYPQFEDHLVINRTDRYRNESINYSVLKPYESRSLFVGLPSEHIRFCQESGLNIPYFEVSNFVELAALLKSCRVFLGNQSMCFGLAEALKVPRILEVCHYAPNVIPDGPNADDFVYQHGMEYYVKQAMK